MANEITLTTERLVLRAFRPSDAEDVFASLNDPTVHCFYEMRTPDLASARKAVEERMAEEFALAIVLKETGKVIGELSGMIESAAPDQKDCDTFSPCWMLHKDHQGKGYAYEAVRAYFDWLFREKGVRRIYAYTEDYNKPSQRLCEKLGMRKEGEHREFVSFIQDENGQPIYENTWVYAILKKEWKPQ